MELFSLVPANLDVAMSELGARAKLGLIQRACSVQDFERKRHCSLDIRCDVWALSRIKCTQCRTSEHSTSSYSAEKIRGRYCG